MGYIVPVDVPNPTLDRGGFKAKALDMQQIEVYARRIEPRHALFLFDSCFSGSIFALFRAAFVAALSMPQQEDQPSPGDRTVQGGNRSVNIGGRADSNVIVTDDRSRVGKEKQDK